MARTLLGGIAIAAGAGLAIGFGSVLGRRAARNRRREMPILEPLIDRLDRIEARVAQVEWSPAFESPGRLPDDVAAVRQSLASIDERLHAQSREIEFLRIRAAEDEKLAEAEMRLTERRFKEVATALPAEIEAIVLPRVADLRERLRGEMKESVDGALQIFEQTLDNRVSPRIAALEGMLLEHSASLADLSHRSSEANMNLQKLVGAVERLCDQRFPLQASAPEPVPASEPTFLELSVSETSVPVRQIVREEEPLPRRVTFAHVIVAAAVALISARFSR